MVKSEPYIIKYEKISKIILNYNNNYSNIIIKLFINYEINQWNM